MLTEQAQLVTWCLGLLATATLVALGVMLRQWRTGRLVIDRRQLRVRLMGGAVLMAIWVLLGALLLGLDPAAQRQAWVACFGAVLLMCVLLLVLAMFDMRLLLLNRLRAESRLASETAKLWKQGRDGS